MNTSELQISSIFSVVSPLIISINNLQLIIQLYLYKLISYKFKSKFYIKSNSKNFTFPAQFLWTGPYLGQLITILFFYHSNENIAISCKLIVTILSVDAFFICKKKIMMQMRAKVIEKESKSTNGNEDEKRTEFEVNVDDEMNDEPNNM